MSKALESAIKIKNLCEQYGWRFQVRGTILTITKTLDGSKNAFTKADMEYGSILELLPTTSEGSTWGTDGGGIGALSSIKSGLFRMNKSGGSKRVLNQLSKIQ